MEEKNQITVDANAETQAESGTNSDSKNDTNDKSNEVDVIGNGQLVKKVIDALELVWKYQFVLILVSLSLSLSCSYEKGIARR